MKMRKNPPLFKPLLILALALVAAAPEPVPAPRAAVAHDFRAMCAFEAKLCGEYDALLAELDGDAGKTLKGEELAKLNTELIGVVRRTDAVVFVEAGKWKPESRGANQESIYGGLYTLREKLNVLSLAAAPSETARLYTVLLDEEQRADKLKGEVLGSSVTVQALEAEAQSLAVLNADATRTWEEIRTLAFNADRMGAPVDWSTKKELTPAGTLVTTHVNALQSRVAFLRDRLAEIREATIVSAAKTPAGSEGMRKIIAERLKAGGLDRDVFEHKGALDGSAPPAPAASSVDIEPGARLQVNLTVSPKLLLDNRPPPQIPKPTTPLPPRGFWQRLTGGSPLYSGREYHTKGSDGKWVTVHEDAEPAETKRIADLRDDGKTSTLGDPGGRAKYTFHQTGGTCALATQAEMFAEAHGIEPTEKNMRAIENEFFERASRTSQFAGNAADPKQRTSGAGTQAEYMGNMLDTPVEKHYLATSAELFKAVSKGKMILVTTNTGKLWNDDNYKNGGHVVAITGAEVDKSGALLGYYINDTGTNEPARFVTAKQFLPAWESHGGVFVEPL